MVKLYAGDSPEAEGFVVHREWACQASPVLKAAFNSEFIEGQTQEYRLHVPDIEDNVVQLLVAWIYTQRIELAQLDIDPRLREEQTFAVHSSYLVKLWVLSDKLLMPQLQNLAISRLHDICEFEKANPMSMLKYIYKNTAEESPLRKYVLARCAAATLSARFFKDPDRFPPEFLIDLVLLLKRNMPKEINEALLGRIDAFHVSEV